MTSILSRAITVALLMLTLFDIAYAEPIGRLGQSSKLEKLVASTYKEYAWTIVFAPAQASSSAVLLTQERLAKLKQIFADDLALAIVNDAQCVNRTGEVCSLDFDILFDSQDSDARELLIRPKSNYRVEACFVDQTQKQKCIEFVGSADKNGMRVYDILYDQTGRSIRTILKLK